MSVGDSGDLFLTDHLREFYHEVIHQKRLIETDLAETEPDSHSSGEAKTEETVSTVWRKLLTFFEK